MRALFKKVKTKYKAMEGLKMKVNETMINIFRHEFKKRTLVKTKTHRGQNCNNKKMCKPNNIQKHDLDKIQRIFFLSPGNCQVCEGKWEDEGR